LQRAFGFDMVGRAWKKGEQVEQFITLDFGSGGKKTAELIDKLILPRFGNDVLHELGDGAIIDGAKRLVFTTDSFVVSPYFFPGGDIGKLAVCGTVNDIAVSGGRPMYLSLSAIIEEGLPVEDLERILDSVMIAAKEAGVMVVTGDTKVVERGKCDGIYLNTAGIGFLSHEGLSPGAICPGDKVLISGTAGDHGTAVMLARNEHLLQGNVQSDCAPLHELTSMLEKLGGNLRVMRDPTRGGLATTLCEFAEGRDFSIELEEERIPVDKGVLAACSILGIDPLYAANEGKLIAVAAPESAEEAVELLKTRPLGENAVIIGTVCEANPGRVLLKTGIGGTRVLTKLSGIQLPRIC
jgi:hydrogenase expression/formation protein HypE